jgi:Tol biopolymer transport system component
VIEKLGSGGMGVVYRAEDERLRRAVAIKVLPPELTRDNDAKERFVLEAQAASALDHPNICTIYEIDETPDGQVFLVMAYYEGETLKRKIDRGPLKLDDALDYGIQIAQGLKKAHDSGIVHRDIKPGNVLVTPDGFVKIVDFGLAKLVKGSALTRTGVVMGTVNYMSPEQALGHTGDQRTDLWSLGVLLYEMIAGQAPFRGDSEIAVAHAIAHTPTPPLTSVRAGLPIEVDRIVGRALAKSPDDRYQTAADLLSELRRLRRETDGQTSSGRTSSRPTGGPAHEPALAPSRGRIAVLAGALVVAGIAIGYALLSRDDVASSLPLLANPVQLAASVGIEQFPTWSPDNRLIAYQSNQAGNFDIWVTQIGGGTPVNRTADFSGDDLHPRWSPDGRQIAFWSAREEGGIFVMSALGGGARRIAPPSPLGTAPPTWSPDGTEIAYTVADASAVHLERLNLRDGTTRRVALGGRPGNARIDLAWSPDGKFVAFVDARNYFAQVTQLWILRIADGRSLVVTDGRTNDWSPTWAPDSRTLYYTSNRGGAMDLWRQPIAGDGSTVDPPQRLTTGLEVASAAISPDGTRLAYSKGRWLGNAWRVPVLRDRPATWADAQQLTFDQAYIETLDVSADGQRLAVSSDRSGNPDVWILPAGGGEMQQFTTDPTPDWHPSWSPDDREIAFYAYRTGNRELWVQPVAGGPARQITRGESESVFPGWSPDGRSMVYNSRVGGSADIWVVPSAGGEARQIVGDPSSDLYPDWSPDGNWVVFQSDRTGAPLLWKVPAAGGAPLPLTKNPGTRPHWSADGKTVLFTRLEAILGSRNVWSVSVDGQTERRLTDLRDRRGFMDAGAFAADDKFLYFTWRDDVADLWVMDLVTNDRKER